MPVHGLWDALRSRGLLEEAKNGEELRQLLLDSKTGLFAEWMAGEDTSTTTCAVVCELLASMTFSVGR